ncbi:MAG: YicC/YloC family endoribonuclease [Oscillospiraceae bacterium]|nr:YicC/YloC family endoribonuclease [Oscillospiraceae bacterium]
MLNSMTGYGRASRTFDTREISVELRSVNHRYLEIGVRLPRSAAFLEEKVKAAVQKRVSRGKADVSISIVSQTGSESVQLNLDLARAYYEAIGGIASELGISGEVDAAAIARFPEVFNPVKLPVDEEELWKEVSEVLEEALDNYCAMRALEGERLKADMLLRADFIEKAVGEIEKNSALSLEKYREKLLARMTAALEGAGIDENRILLEAAIYADRSAVDEETVRLRSHLLQLREIVASSEPVGRKLDFLIQEINREINTIGSKANDLGVTSIVVDVKAEIEKIREQVQNVE